MIRLPSPVLLLLCALAAALSQASSLHASPLYPFSITPQETDSWLSQFLPVGAPCYGHGLLGPRVFAESRSGAVKK